MGKAWDGLWCWWWKWGSGLGWVGNCGCGQRVVGGCWRNGWDCDDGLGLAWVMGAQSVALAQMEHQHAASTWLGLTGASLDQFGPVWATLGGMGIKFLLEPFWPTT